MIDLYCERLGDGYFAEPINALSNLAFFIAAFFAWKITKKQCIQDIGLSLLIALMVAIGIGSLLFHVFANKASQLADLIPIFLFQLLYLWLYTKKVLHCKLPVRILLSLVLLTSIYVSANYLDYLNGSLLYAPTMVVLVLICFYHLTKSIPGRNLAIWALFLFIMSLLFRTFDNHLCELIDTGTHFLWHLLNGLVIFLMYKLLVKNWTRA